MAAGNNGTHLTFMDSHYPPPDDQGLLGYWTDRVFGKSWKSSSVGYLRGLILFIYVTPELFNMASPKWRNYLLIAYALLDGYKGRRAIDPDKIVTVSHPPAPIIETPDLNDSSREIGQAPRKTGDTG